jgi:signal transduction histidine kinase
MPTIPFKVDSALLKELGERLVGKPHIALAELIKNGYDADAKSVRISVDLSNDSITVRDNGNGMDEEEFINLWMRIGSTHKFAERTSRHFHRPMTGSKGVGRLSVQFLAKELEMTTVSEMNLHLQLKANIRWDDAVMVQDLTSVMVTYEIIESDVEFEKGTTMFLKHLNHHWDKTAIQELAKDIWWLQSPFRRNQEFQSETDFKVDFTSSNAELEKMFKNQIGAILNIWIARIIGKNTNGKVKISLEFIDEKPLKFNYDLSRLSDRPSTLMGGDFEIRIYHLLNRQPNGLKVDEAREYLNKYGGVHVYDAGFHLPFYGNPMNDWLRVEQTHSHRLSQSKLLPEELQIPEGLSHLPTLSRMLGVVHVDTSRETDLDISITRDRIVDSDAYSNLTDMIRYALDLYAMERAKRVLSEHTTKRPTKKPKEKISRLEGIIEGHGNKIPSEIRAQLIVEINDLEETIIEENKDNIRKMGVLGSLATAGLSSLAYQHELKKQFSAVDDIVEQLERLKVSDEGTKNQIAVLKKDLGEWVKRARGTNAIFAHLADSSNMKIRERFEASDTIKKIIDQTKVLLKGVDIKTNSISSGMLLPSAAIVEWGAIFQNVLVNAYNAMIDCENKVIEVSMHEVGDKRFIVVQDTGSGIDLAGAETMFLPFERRLEISQQRKALGYGGTGLGLTIVRLVADGIGCKTRFIEPEEGYSTAFELSWEEN